MCSNHGKGGVVFQNGRRSLGGEHVLLHRGTKAVFSCAGGASLHSTSSVVQSRV